jgi:hypothetical protein
VTYGEAMLKDVTPAMFARQPVVNGKHIVCNHPAWVFGHLSIYSSRCMELLGLPVGVTAKPAGFEDLFKNGTECKDDPSGTIYPKMEQITSLYIHGYKAVLAAMPEVPDEAFMRENPATGRFKEMFPLVGGAVCFLMTGHAMSHLGQVSTWRRCMGLGSAT